jgi:signal transduction histidine kinase
MTSPLPESVGDGSRPRGPSQPGRSGVRLVSLIGFSAVLTLMAVVGAESVRVLQSIESENIQVTRQYLSRHHALDRVRSRLYLSGTLVRDYLLDSDPGRALTHLAELRKVGAQANAALEDYGSDALPEDAPQLATLRNELSEYWRTLSPTFDWEPGQRRSLGYRFLELQVLPRRDAMLRLADRVDSVNEAVLKAGEVRSAEIYRSFRSRILVILTITLGIGVGVAGLSIMQILRLERDARLRYQETVRARSELEELSARLVDAQEQERRAISRELHDEVGQSLSALLVDLGNVLATVPADNVPARRLLDTIKKLAEQSLQSVRNMALLLRPSMLDDFGLVPALRWQTREASRRTGTFIQLTAEETADELPDDYKTCVYRVVQEALNNVSRHSGAQSVQVVVRQEKDRLLLSIQDDGKGFNARHTRGLGLVGMEERVRHLGGSFVIRSEPGQGTHLRVDLPLREPTGGLKG